MKEILYGLDKELKWKSFFLSGKFLCIFISDGLRQCSYIFRLEILDVTVRYVFSVCGRTLRLLFVKNTSGIWTVLCVVSLIWRTWKRLLTTSHFSQCL